VPCEEETAVEYCYKITLTRAMFGFPFREAGNELGSRRALVWGVKYDVAGFLAFSRAL